MKKLNKLCINTEKLMKNDELTTLRGGYGGACCMCYAFNGYFTIGAIAASSEEMCHDLCESLFPPDSYGVWNC